jgi:hypothetical protein
MWSRAQQLSARSALLGLAALDVLGVLLADLAAAFSTSTTVQPASQAIWTVIYLTLIWAVWHRSSAARWALIAINALSALGIVVFSIGLTVIEVALAFDVVSLALLFAPQLRAHVQQRAALSATPADPSQPR